MLKWAMAFLFAMVVAGILGFGGLTGTLVGLFEVLFWFFLVMFFAALLMNRQLAV